MAVTPTSTKGTLAVNVHAVGRIVDSIASLESSVSLMGVKQDRSSKEYKIGANGFGRLIVLNRINANYKASNDNYQVEEAFALAA